MKELDATSRNELPKPYDRATLVHRRRGVADDATTDVFIDADGAFAMLHPRPTFDYGHYVSRENKLGLTGYKSSLGVISRRFDRIADLFPSTGTVLEVGAADGAFLDHLRSHRPGLGLIAVEPDRATRSAREALDLKGTFVDLEAAAAAGVAADIVCLFHVFEHISKPASFLADVRNVLAPDGRIIIEVPSLDDPLLSMYRLPAYEAFYFQRQHPFVYSSGSLKRVLEEHGLRVVEVRAYQRYGLENHFAWLIHGRPGGDPGFAAVFAPIEQAYRRALEAAGKTDTVFAIAVAG